MSEIKEQIDLVKRDLGFLEERIESHENTNLRANVSDELAIIKNLKKARREISDAMNRA